MVQAWRVLGEKYLIEAEGAAGENYLVETENEAMDRMTGVVGGEQVELQVRH